jgi:hypothetical protein
MADIREHLLLAAVSPRPKAVPAAPEHHITEEVPLQL